MAKFTPRALRHYAEGFVVGLCHRHPAWDQTSDDLVTSLVRQWQSYDGNATLFIGGEQSYFPLLSRDPIEAGIVPEPTAARWMERVLADWKIAADCLPEIYDALNSCQSAEVTNTDGELLRIWVDPRHHRKGIESLTGRRPRQAIARDYHRIAAGELRQNLGLDMAEAEALADFVVRQWARHQGHASLFLDGEQQLTLTFTEGGDGTCTVAATRRRGNLEPLLTTLGFARESIAEVIGRINRGQEIAFRSLEGQQSILAFDPKAGRVVVRTAQPHGPHA